MIENEPTSTLILKLIFLVNIVIVLALICAVSRNHQLMGMFAGGEVKTVEKHNKIRQSV